MAETEAMPKELEDEIVHRKQLGDKKFHSESSLQNFGEDEEPSPDDMVKDPGVQNATLNVITEPDRRRAVSQPGPISGGLITASAARAARKKNVNYVNSINENSAPRIVIHKLGDELGTATPTGDRGSPFLPMYNGSFRRNGDLKSLNGYRPYNSASNTPRKRSVNTMDAQSLRSVETQAPPSTSAEDNRKLTRKYLTLVSSTMYAILLVTLGLIIYITDPFIKYPVASIYSIVLTALGFLYQIYLIIDIQAYKKVALSNQKIKHEHEEKIAEYFRKQEEEFGSPGDQTPDGFRSMAFPSPALTPLSHRYCFSQGRHSGSFYLKLGAAGFALGNLVHSVLLIVVQMSYILDEETDSARCVEFTRFALDLFQPLYCLLQLFFVFKYSNVIILSAQGLARFGFMHMIGSSLCFWISAIVRETVLALTIYAQYVYGNSEAETPIGNNTTTIILTATDMEAFSGKLTQRFLDISGLYDEQCLGSAAISTIFESFSPYLYPFTVEFNILIVAVYYIIWSKVGHCHNEDTGSNSEINNGDGSLYDGYSVCKIPTANEDNDYTSNLVIYADCHASNKGLFAGLAVVVVIVGSLIVGFVFSSVGGELLGMGAILNDSTKLGLHGVMLFAVILAFTQTTKLDINEHPISLLDDILLFICLPPFFMEAAFSLVATISILNLVRSIDFVVMTIQILIQTPLIMDALRRCSNSRKLRRKKPARELVMFLLITNVGMWLFYTFSYKAPDSLDERYEYYGKVLWSILGHVSLPLIMFYRFHSSVCFADIWDSAYKPGSEH